MHTNYTITQEDYINGVKLHHAFNRKKSIIYFLFASSISISVLLLNHAPLNFLFFLSYAGGILGAFIWIWFYQNFILSMLAKRDYKRYKSIQEPKQLTLSDDALIIDKKRVHVEIAFNTLLHYKENEACMILYTMPRLFYILPKKLEKEGFDFALLRERLAHYNIPKLD